MTDKAIRLTAKNIIKKYGGRDKFQLLIDMFSRGESGAKIAAGFAVSRQRVNQWKHLFGIEQVVYAPRQVIADLLEKKPPPPRSIGRTEV